MRIEVTEIHNRGIFDVWHNGELSVENTPNVRLAETVT
jgi:hypothetical protein